jgi:cytochrome c
MGDAGVKLMIGLSVMAAVAAGPALADAQHGKLLYAQCSACHSLNPTNNDPGPNLKGVVGRKAASVAGYSYSGAMRRSAIVWDEATLNAFLANPRVVVPRSRMPGSGVPDPQDRSDLIAYLKSR